MDHPTTSPSALLAVDVLATGATTLARLEGELDAATAALLVEAVEPAILAGSTALVLDCGALRFCDSSGLRALVILRHLLPAGGTVSLVRTNDLLRRILAVTGLAGAFEVS